MKLGELTRGICTVPDRYKDLEIAGIASDSREVRKGDLFIAVRGPKEDGGQYIRDALSRGAAAVVSTAGADVPADVCFLRVPDSKTFLQKAAVRFFGDPSARVRTIGVTGTNGKTTVTFLLESIFQAAGKPCGVIGTINHRFGGKVFESQNTTPGVVQNLSYLNDMAREGIRYCVMEVSSHALAQDRVAGIRFSCAVFTNLTSDHLDYHSDQENYFLAKSKLFTGLSSDACAVINQDDPFSDKLIGMTECQVKTYGVRNPADLQIVDLKADLFGSRFVLSTADKDIEISTGLIGLHNVYNIAAACGVALQEEIPVDCILAGIRDLTTVPGRLEPVDCGQDFHVFVDYAHTEDALRNVLLSLRNVSSSKLILVFGCGGDRDREKRPLMGRAAGDLADTVIITNDNPRSEDSEVIAGQIQSGFERKNYQVILDRRKAIAEALRLARPGDAVLIAGKGHEDYQIFKDKTISFDDRAVVRECLSTEKIRK